MKYLSGCLFFFPLFIFFVPKLFIQSLSTRPNFEWKACWKLDEENCKGSSEVVVEAPIAIEDKTLEEIKARLEDFIIPDGFKGFHGNEKVHPEYGLNPAFFGQLITEWKQFDWRKVENIMNSWNPKSTVIDGLKIHFFHVKSNSQDPARKEPPVMFLHGWPGSVWEFNKIIPILINDEDIASDIIIPSLPGYGFSEGAEKPGLEVCQAGIIFVKLMRRLKLDKFICQGGDWGSMVCKCGAVLAPETVAGIHLNFFPMAPPLWSIIFLPHLHQNPLKNIPDLPYLLEHAFAPHTIGLALKQSPLSVAAWISEKMVAWSDPRTPVDIEDIIANIMIYCVTDSIVSSIRLYKETLGKGEARNKNQYIGNQDIPVRTALIGFPVEIYQPPKNEYILKSHFPELIQFTTPDKGGHFAALEVPEILINDLKGFLNKVNV